MKKLFLALLCCTVIFGAKAAQRKAPGKNRKNRSKSAEFIPTYYMIRLEQELTEYVKKGAAVHTASGNSFEANVDSKDPFTSFAASCFIADELYKLKRKETTSDPHCQIARRRRLDSLLESIENSLIENPELKERLRSVSAPPYLATIANNKK